MLVSYGDFEFVIDPEIDFCMLADCYRLGCNCYNCHERILDGCPVDEVDWEELFKLGEQQCDV